MNYMNYEEFLHTAWDYVSENVVSDDYWEDNQEFIQELSHDMYNIYNKSLIDNGDDTFTEKLTPRLCGKMLECVFSQLIRRENARRV